MSRETRFIVWTLARVVAVLTIAIWFVLHLRRWDHFFGLTFPSWLRIPGAVLAAGGGLLVLFSGASLATRGILEQPGDRLAPRSLSTGGLFRYSRNPMSLGVVVLFAGLGLMMSPAILAFSGLLFLGLHLLVVYVEEPKLRNRFGQIYLEYEQRTSRWLLPQVSRRRM
jgi:protein-S-isoprenylcysteine O-methyltransferase Ste14